MSSDMKVEDTVDNDSEEIPMEELENGTEFSLSQWHTLDGDVPEKEIKVFPSQGYMHSAYEVEFSSEELGLNLITDKNGFYTVVKSLKAGNRFFIFDYNIFKKNICCNADVMTYAFPVINY
jgi:hypothetical protein